MKIALFPWSLNKDMQGSYAECPLWQGCYTQGEIYEETLGNIKDAVALHIQDRIASGEKIDRPEMVSVATVEVAA